MKKKEILNTLDMGNSVAEYDSNLVHYYVKTNATNDFVCGRYDIVRGVKGSGKTAMLITVCDNQQLFEELQDKVLVKAISIKGDPEFKTAFSNIEVTDEDIDRLVDAWKIYIINTLWKEGRKIFSELDEFEKILKEQHLLSDKNGFFENITYALKRVKLIMSCSTKNDGSMSGSIELRPNDEGKEQNNERKDEIGFNYIFEQLDTLLKKNGGCIWLLIDRLDDAFPDKSYKESVILKALLYAYKDICVFENFKLKIFIRDDLFKLITQKGFTSLTHVNAKTMQSLSWDKDSVEKVLCERLLHNKNYFDWMKSLGYDVTSSNMTKETREKILFHLIKNQIDVGNNNPDAIGWMINHTKDGTNVFTPRDILILLDKARQEQLKIMENENIEEIEEDYLISSSAVRKALEGLSRDKMETQMFAEYPKYRPWILKFKDQKAEQTVESLEQLLGKQWKYRVSKLVEIGFLEEKGSTYKIPFVFRAYLNVSQGRVQKNKSSSDYSG